METSFISVVIPTYKRPLLLARCLLALSYQTLDKSGFEIIIVSDGPDDTSSEVARQLLAGTYNYRFLSLQEKKGPAAARNFGWRNATGSLIAFTDDDCVPDKNWLISLLTAYKGEMLAAFTGSIMVPIESRPTDFARNTANLEDAEFVTANCCVTKEALQLTCGFDERFLLAWREDSDLEFKLLSNDIPVKRVKAAVVVHPVREAAWGVSVKEQHKGIFNALLYKKFPALYRTKIQASPAWNYYLIIISFSVLVVGFISNDTSLVVPSFVVWLLLMISFINKRLKDTSRKPGHVIEMIITSIAIPFLSVYWQLYGAIKYRVLFF